ncbi:protein jagged-1b isoform X3 [Lepisosteus oculatus]|uniref:protein jagged-1b isoform X3 n=1 Tax=Lepisosteus oculatus TaxID=7918 RepID=UPI00372389F2
MCPEPGATRAALTGTRRRRGGEAMPDGRVVCVVLLVLQPQVLQAVGVFELQIEQLQNTNGLLLSGGCCDGGGGGGAGGRCPQADQCDTFLRACLKEYQVRVSPTGPCTFGAGSTGVLGGNSFSLRHRTPGEQVGRIGIPFKYAWPKSFSLVLEVLDHDNDTVGAGHEELIDRVLLSSMLNPSEQWQSFWHHGRVSLEYKLRFLCDANYYGPFCNKFCRARDDFFGHFTCDATGSKVCMEGWMGPECRQAVCRQGCHLAHGYCSTPGECKCHYGWEGPLCDRCVTFPGCVHGSCTEPWMCVCDTNWGGLLCDKDLNYCGTHQPCQNGGTCANTEPNEYQCICRDGFRGKNCEIVEHACLSNPCANGGTCVEEAEGFYCVCPEGWTGPSCTTDTNECDRGVCVHAVACHNLIGGYFCDCQPGWTGQDCDITNHTCQGKCQNGAVCEESLTGYRCQCPPGFTGSYCQTRASHCDSAPCLNGGHCAEEEETPQCHCPLGYSGKHCEEVLDLCNPNPCQQGAPCQSTEGGYLCACPQGYEGKECLSLKDTCHEPHCQGEPSGSTATHTGSGSTLYVVMVVLLAMLVVGTTLCIYLLAQLRRRRKERQHAGQDEGINNQRECVTLIRNLGGPPPVPRCREEIELSLPPTPETKKPRRSSAKLDISNREREKLNRFHFSDSQEVEV